ncbi:MAG TPA: hypothetical protein VN739_07635 [Nitrososphaerales archaeon]|nr:hypothetical protein [Nitrososphaerales archaeon]
MSLDVLTLPPRIFRSVRAGVIYDKTEFEKSELDSIERLYRQINVELIPGEKLGGLEDEFGILGMLGQRALRGSRESIENFNCLKVGFYPEGGSLEPLRKSLKLVNAAIICLGSKSPIQSLSSTVYHFYESLTLPSLLNIDLADVESIAGGIGISFNESGDSSEDVISQLPPECYVAKSALLHFSCSRNVTLEEVYRISKMISTRKAISPLVHSQTQDQIKMFKRIRLKMGLRIAQNAAEGKIIPRISLTGILFGIRA